MEQLNIEYTGSLNIEKMNPIERKAYTSWKNQRERCSNPNNKRYEWSGAKGISVDYGSRAFIGWYCDQWNKLGPFKRPNVSRLDHDKSYCFENIELCECSENVKERNDRRGNPTDSIPISLRNIATGEVKCFNSIREAARSIDIDRGQIKALFNGNSKYPRHNWRLG